MSKVEDVKNCWLLTIVTILAIIGLLLGNLYYASKVSSLESEVKALQKGLDEVDALMKERLNSLDGIILERLRNVSINNNQRNFVMSHNTYPTNYDQAQGLYAQ